MYIAISIITVAIALFLSAWGYLWYISMRKILRFTREPDDFDTVSVYVPKSHGSVITERGWIILEEGVNYASKCGAPLILMFGQTVSSKRRAETLVYRIGASDRFEFTDIIPVYDPLVRETSGEVEQTLKICREQASGRHLVIGPEPQIARIRLLWKRARTGSANPKIIYLPVEGPWQYWIWETFMLLICLAGAPKYKLKRLLSGKIGRKG